MSIEICDRVGAFISIILLLKGLSNLLLFLKVWHTWQDMIYTLT